VCELTLTVDKLTLKLLLELLDAFGQRPLRDVAHVRSTHEVQRTCNGEKIPNLMELHRMFTVKYSCRY
jgi:hypothetical protein